MDRNAQAREVLDAVRYVVLGTTDADGRPRTSPVLLHARMATPTSTGSRTPPRTTLRTCTATPGSRGWCSTPTVVPGPETRAVYLTGTAREIPADELAEHLPHAFDATRGGRAFGVDELTGDADIRLWVLHVEQWEVHVRGSDPELGTGTDRRIPVDPRPPETISG